MDHEVDETPERKVRFSIYRAKDAKDYGEDVQSIDEMTPVMAEGLAHHATAQEGGSVVKLLYAAPGFSLTYVWFKSGYPLPVHSHGNDCLYNIIAGSIKIGNEVLGVGDGFFVGSNVAYTYETGPEGVEVLEFRNSDKLNIRFRSDDKASWDKMAEVLTASQAAWSVEPRPSTIKRDAS